VAAGAPIYGVTTGVGPLVVHSSDAPDFDRGGEELLAHLGAGCGGPAPATVSRACLILRTHSLAQGCSGVRPAVFRALLRVIQRGLVPIIPRIGSLGASGDLVPLSHAVSILIGNGTVFGRGRAVSGRVALTRAGLRPTVLSRRDALALVNGTSFLAAYAAVAVARADRLISRAEALTGWIFASLGCGEECLDDRLHASKGHPGPPASAAAIRAEAGRLGWIKDSSRPLQEIYSIRCAPQILGACRDQLTYARGLIEAEMNSISDNPLILAGDEPCALHGGNFHGQHAAFAADALNAALTQVAVLTDRQLDALLNPRINGGAPPLLAARPGPTSGLAGAQLTSTAIVAEMRLRAQAIATSSIPTNGGNQDVVPMAALAARSAYTQTAALARVLAILGMALVQLGMLRREAVAPGRSVGPPPWMPDFEPLFDDRPLTSDIRRITRAWLEPPPT
jgi:histidine ammonia-lyase/tyrosine ammonia-lyase